MGDALDNPGKSWYDKVNMFKDKLLFIGLRGCRGEAPAPHLGGRQCRGRPGAPRRAAGAARRFLKNKICVKKPFQNQISIVE